MIQANELRVGNWVNVTGMPIKLEGVKLAFIFEEDGLITRCEPIPLTPEILEKCGFNSDGLGCYVKEKLFYQLSENRMHYSFYYAVYNQFNYKIETEHSLNVISHPKFLHQLQNLYFALTGEELKISL